MWASAPTSALVPVSAVGARIARPRGCDAGEVSSNALALIPVVGAAISRPTGRDAGAPPPFPRRGRCPHRPADLVSESALVERSGPSLPLRGGPQGSAACGRISDRSGWAATCLGGLQRGPGRPSGNPGARLHHDGGVDTVQTAFRSRRSLRKRPLAARADVGIGPYRRQQRCSGTNGFPQPPYPPREAASRRGPMNASAPTARLRQTYQPTMCSGRIRVKTAVCDVSPCAEAAGAALVKTSVAVTAIRFYWPARSREGAGSMGRDSPVARNGPGNASSGDARRAAPRGTGGRSPRRVFGTFPR